MKADVASLLQRLPVIFDTSEALQVLREFRDPNTKLRDLVRRGFVIRIRRGLYAIAPAFRRNPFPREILANRIYTPSYISLDWALAYHNLIPETPRQVTSVAPRNSPSSRTKRFMTPEGVFTYHFIPVDAYSLGYRLYKCAFGDRNATFMMASPEKALADKVFFEKGLDPVKREVLEYLTDELRIEKDILAECDYDSLKRIAEAYQSRKIKALAAVFRGGRFSGHHPGNGK